MDRIKKILILILAIVPPIIVNNLLDTNFISIIILSIIVSVFLVYRYSLLPLILSIIISLIVYAYIIVIPYSFYSAWFNHLSTSIPSGRITDLIVSIWIFSYVYNSINLLKDKTSIIKNLIFSTAIYCILFSKYYLLLSIPVLIILFNTINILKFGLKATISIVVIFACALYVSYFMSDKLPINGSKYVNNMSYKIRSFLISNFPDIDIPTAIPGSEGLSESSGKPPILTSSKLFKFWGTPGESYYLRMSIENSDNSEKKVNKEFFQKRNLDSIKLEVLSDFLPLIPTLNGGGYSTTLVASSPLTRNETIYINKKISDSTYPEQTFLANAKEATASDSRVKQLSLQLKGKDNYETVANIKKFLKENYVYSLETKERSNYLEDFLFKTKEGFCVHFSRSFIILAKLNGIPTREVSGYHVKIKRPENGSYEGFTFVTGKNSHMWAEVYLDNKWQTIEVTPGYQLTEIRQTGLWVKKQESDELSSIRTVEGKKANILILTLITVFITTLTVILLFKIRKYPIKRLVNKASKKGIPHPAKIGWVEWNMLTFGNLNNKDLFIEYSYKNRVLSAKDKTHIKKLCKLVANNFHDPT